MRVPVILMVPAHDHFRSVAEEAATNTSAGVNPALAPQFPGVELDPAFPAVPLGSAEPTTATVEEATPAASQFFAVRGHVTTANGTAPPTQAGDAIVFSDPQIGA